MGYRGRHLKIRPKRRGPVVVATAATMSIGAPASAATHVVRKGETLSAIASRHGTTVSALVKLNDLNNANFIVTGQRLRIGRAQGSRTHVVKAGETLSQIASRYGTTVSALARVNRLKDPNLIAAGARLKVPGGVRGGASPPSPSAPTSIASSLDAQARAHGIDPALVKAVAWQESGWRQNVKSSAGAIGVMQVMPATARWVNEYLGGAGHNLDVHVADDNIHLGVMYLRHLIETQGSVRRALAAYYSGPGNVERRLNAGQRAYVNNVLALMKRY